MFSPFKKSTWAICLLLLIVSFAFMACPSSSDPLVAPPDPKKSPLMDYGEKEVGAGEETSTQPESPSSGGEESGGQSGTSNSGGENAVQPEISPKMESITGNITSIVTLEDYVYACDDSTGTIYVRWKFAETWGRSNKMPDGKTIKKLTVGGNSTDSNTSKPTLYALAQDKTLWMLNRSTEDWEQVNLTNSEGNPQNGVASFTTVKTIFDLGYHHQTGKDSEKAFILDNNGHYFDLIGTAYPHGGSSETWMSTVVTEQGAGYYYSPNNGEDNKVAFYASSNNKSEMDLGSTVLSLACSPRNLLYVATSTGLKKISLNIYGNLSGSATDIPIGAGAGSVQSVFVQELTIDGQGFEVIVVGCSNGLWSYNSYDKTWKQNKFGVE